MKGRVFELAKAIEYVHRHTGHWLEWMSSSSAIRLSAATSDEDAERAFLWIFTRLFRRCDAVGYGVINDAEGYWDASVAVVIVVVAPATIFSRCRIARIRYCSQVGIGSPSSRSTQYVFVTVRYHALLVRDC